MEIVHLLQFISRWDERFLRNQSLWTGFCLEGMSVWTTMKLQNAWAFSCLPPT